MSFYVNTDFSQIEPDDGSGQLPTFPVSASTGWLCAYDRSQEVKTKAGQADEGVALVIYFKGLEGAVQGREHAQRYNVVNKNDETLRITSRQFSAIAHCVGHTQVGNVDEWKDRPLRIVTADDSIGSDGKTYAGRSKIVKYLTANGHSPKEAGGGVMESSSGQNAGFKAAAQNQNGGGNFGGGAQQQQQRDFNPDQQQQQQQGGEQQQQGDQGGAKSAFGGGSTGQPSWVRS